MQLRLPKQLLVALTAPSLLCSAFFAPQLAFGQGQDSDPKVHVYPGAQPINVGPGSTTGPDTQPAPGQPAAAPDSQPSAAPDQPDTSPVPDQVGGPGPGDGDNAQPHATSSKPSDNEAKPEDYDERAEQEKKAQDEIAAAQHYALGAHYFGKWDLDLAELECDEAVSICPELKIAHRDLCLISLLKLNLSRSLAEFMMVTGIADPLAYNVKDKMDLDEKATRLHYKKALWWGKQYNWPESITELLWAQTYSPNNAAIHHSLAFAYASSGDFQKAEDEYKVTFGEEPQDASAHADFANLLLDNGQMARAEAEMHRAVELSPNAAALHVDLGWIAESHQDYATATKEFQTAVGLSPKHAGLWAHLGRLLERQGQVAQAQEAYSKALSLDGDYQDAKSSLDRLKQQKPSA